MLESYLGTTISGVPIIWIMDKTFVGGKVRHTLEDTKINVHMPTVVKVNKILRIFVAEFLNLEPPMDEDQTC